MTGGVRPVPSVPRKAATPPAPTKEELAATVRANATYQGLQGAAKTRADEILAFAATSPKGTYYLTKLLLLLNTSDNPPAETAKSQSAKVDDSAKAAAAKREVPKELPWYERMQKLVERVLVESEEERLTASSDRKWETLTSKDWNKTYQVDRRDPKNIYVKSKVRIDGTADMKAKIASLEDAIEKAARIKGYVADLEFVDYDGPDVFTVKSDPTGWTTENNWVGTAEALSHEWGHQLGLDDEYDYIESHAQNRNMKMETRLLGFTVEMKRRRPIDGDKGKMSQSSNPMLDRHACEVAQYEDVEKCVEKRTGKKYSKYGPDVPKAPSPQP